MAVLPTAKVTALIALIAMAACDSKQTRRYDDVPSVQIKVLAASDECQIQNVLLKCDQLAAHLRDTLKIEMDTMVFVSTDSAGLPMRRLSEVAELLRRVGFTQATAISFINEADGTTIEPP